MNSDHFSSSVPLTIIPQRKHRKLLKDGSGTEVWPESIEQVFIQGLRDYWNSPYAAYSQSRGRSRWRNQFLVDYLHKQGIKRSKKQVASHIQVLRNMWKGAPEYHLVAGVDELFLESAVPVKMEDHWDTNSLITLDWSPSSSISPDFSPADSQSEFPPTPEQRHHRQSRNKATAAYLSADGMSPFSINLNALAHPSAQVQPPFTLRIRLCVPTMNDARTPPTFHGFLGGVALEHLWSVACRCITKVYENNVCVSEETGFLNITHINMGAVGAAFPESPLSRCRWLDAFRAVVITQEIVVDDETLLLIIYEIDRRNGSMPSAALLGYQKFWSSDKGAPGISLSPSPRVNHAIPHTQSSVRHTSLPSGIIRFPITKPPTF